MSQSNIASYIEALHSHFKQVNRPELGQHPTILRLADTLHQLALSGTIADIDKVLDAAEEEQVKAWPFAFHMDSSHFIWGEAPRPTYLLRFQPADICDTISFATNGTFFEVRSELCTE